MADLLRLEYVGRMSLKKKKAGLREPSGIEFDAFRGGFWVVDDESPTIFNLNAAGGLRKKRCFSVGQRGFEGICGGPKKHLLYVVNENRDSILLIDSKKKAVVAEARLRDLPGYEPDVRQEDWVPNTGLEGIAFCLRSQTLFVLNESRPGLLFRIHKNLSRVLACRRLDESGGFPAGIDYSGICYGGRGRLFWIVSDLGRRVFLYDWRKSKVLQSFPLVYRKKKSGRIRTVKQAEGVSFAWPDGDLYIVSDAETRLYHYRVLPAKDA